MNRGLIKQETLFERLQVLLGERGDEGNRAVLVKEIDQGGAFSTTLAGGIASLANGVVGAPSLRFKSSPLTGMFSPSTDQIGFAIGGVLVALLTSTGISITGTITGTAVTQTNVDTTAGRLLKVGDYGIGAGSSIDLSDWNDATINGAIYDGNGALNAPVASGWFLGTYHRLSSLYGIQTVSGLTGSGAGKMFQRRLDAGVWQAWVEVYSTASPPPGGSGGNPLMGWFI